MPSLMPPPQTARSCNSTQKTSVQSTYSVKLFSIRDGPSLSHYHVEAREVLQAAAASPTEPLSLLCASCGLSILITPEEMAKRLEAVPEGSASLYPIDQWDCFGLGERTVSEL